MAPGTANSTTFLSLLPLAAMSLSFTDGSLSPTLCLSFFDHGGNYFHLFCSKGKILQKKTESFGFARGAVAVSESEAN
jgi:hypothetical protein